MSKAFGLAGMRIGYIISHPSNIKMFSKAFNGKEVTNLAKQAALTVLRNIDWYANNASKMFTLQNKIVKLMIDNNDDVQTTPCNFIIVKNDALYEHLLNHNIIIRKLPGGSYRMTIPSEKNTDILIECLMKFYVLSKMDVWCICLQDRDDKYQYVSQHLKENGFHNINWYRPERDPRGCEYGCWESHKYCLQHSTKKYSLIFEDDVKFTCQINWKLLYDFMNSNCDWETFFLGSTLMGLEKQFTDKIWKVVCNQAHAYIANNNICHKDDFDPEIHHYGVDDYYRLNTKQYALIDPVCIQKAGFVTDNKWYNINTFQNFFQHPYLYEFLQTSGNTIAKYISFLPTHIQKFINPIPCLLTINIGLQNILMRHQ